MTCDALQHLGVSHLYLQSSHDHVQKLLGRIKLLGIVFRIFVVVLGLPSPVRK